MNFCLFRHDPGPCPVDDTPHTACTADENVMRAYFTPQASVTTTTPVPAVLREMQANPTVTQPEPVTFTTKTYRRALHGRRAKGTTR